MANSNIIELNGKRYDANTGLVQKKSSTSPPKSKVSSESSDHASSSKTASVKKVIDDFRSSATPHFKTMPSLRPRHPHKLPARTIRAPRKIHLTHAHKPETSHTLMRTGLPKPKASSIKLSHQVQTHAGTAPVKHTPYAQHVAKINPDHLRQAYSVHKSHVISRFGAHKPTATPVIKQTAPLAVKSSPASSHEASLASTAHQATQSATKLAAARRHRTKHHHGLRGIGVMTAVLAILVVGGFLIYKNIPNIEVKIASFRAGVPAEIPAYRPAGFTFAGPVRYATGIVYVSFRSVVTGETLTVAQQKSNWDSQTLIENDAGTLGAGYQTLEVQGRTIYVYGHGDAVWVNNGVLFQISGTADLTTDQITSLAAST